MESSRDLDHKMFSGVCAGLGRQFGISVTALRIAFVIAAFLGGWGILIYLALWVIMPPGTSRSVGCRRIVDAGLGGCLRHGSRSRPVPRPRGRDGPLR